MKTPNTNPLPEIIVKLLAIMAAGLLVLYLALPAVGRLALDWFD